MSRIMRKPAFCICENKDPDQLRGNREADQRLCFRYMDSTIPLLPKSEISSLQPYSVVVQPGLCWTWTETRKTGILTTRLKSKASCNSISLLYGESDNSHTLGVWKCDLTLFKSKNNNYYRKFFSSPEPRLIGELIGYPCSGVRPSYGRTSSTISNINICNQWADHNEILSEVSYMHSDLDEGKAASGFGPDWIKTLVSMATDTSHRVIMEKTVWPLFLSCFSSDSFYTCR